MKDASCQGDAKLEIEVGSCRQFFRRTPRSLVALGGRRIFAYVRNDAHIMGHMQSSQLDTISINIHYFEPPGKHL